MTKFTLHQAIALETELNKIEFQGVGIGALIGLNIILENVNGTKQGDISKSFKIWIQQWFIFPNKNKYIKKYNKTLNELAKYQLFFGVSNGTTRITGFFKPLIEHFDNDYVFLGHDRIKAMRQQQYNYYLTGLGSDLYGNEWYIDYKKTFKALKSVLKKHAIHWEQRQRLYAKLSQATSVLSFYNQLFKSVKPKKVIVDHDRMPYQAGLVAAAQLNNIPTYTFIHGDIHPPNNYVPFLSDYIFCWGEQQVKALQSYLKPYQSFIKIGNNKLNRVDFSLKNELISKLQLNGKIVAVLGSNPIPLKLRHDLLDSLIEIFQSALPSVPNLMLVVKLHPVEQLTDYEKYIGKYTFLKIFKSEINVAESIIIADVSIIHNSNYGLDVLAGGGKVMVADTIKMATGLGEILVKEEVAIKITNPTSFIMALEFFKQPGNAYFDKVEKYLNFVSAYLGTEADKRLIETVSQ